MNNIVTRIRSLFAATIRAYRVYFVECRDEIALRNLKLLRTVCWVCIALYVGLMAVTLVIAPDKLIAPHYAAILPLAGAMLVYIHCELGQTPFDSRRAQHMVFLAYAVFMAFIIQVSVFPHPDVPSAYFSLFLVMTPVMFILPAWQTSTVTLLSLIVFIALALGFKNPAVWSHDVFEACIGAVFSFVVILLMTQFRLQADTLKIKYFEMSRLDALTGLLNKGSGLAAFEQYLVEKPKHEPCAVLFLDIDHFKNLNDSFGHLEGDHILTKTGQAMVDVCRRDDIVCRFGGDEFMVVLKGSSLSSARAKALEMRSHIEAINLPDGGHPTCSIGVSGELAASSTADDYIAHADAALYRVKEAGRDAVGIFNQAESE